MGAFLWFKLRSLANGLLNHISISNSFFINFSKNGPQSLIYSLITCYVIELKKSERKG